MLEESESAEALAENKNKGKKAERLDDRKVVPLNRHEIELTLSGRKIEPVRARVREASSYNKRVAAIHESLLAGGVPPAAADNFLHAQCKSYWKIYNLYVPLCAKNLIELKHSGDQVYATIHWPGKQVLTWVRRGHFTRRLLKYANAFIAADLPALGVSFFLMAARISKLQPCIKSLDEVDKFLNENPKWAMPFELRDLLEAIAQQQGCSEHAVLAKIRRTKVDSSDPEFDAFRQALHVEARSAHRVLALMTKAQRSAVTTLFVKTRSIQLDVNQRYVWHDFVLEKSLRKALRDMASVHDALMLVAREGSTELAMTMCAHLLPGIVQYEKMNETEGPEKVLGALHRILKEYKTPDRVSDQLLAFLEANIKGRKEKGSQVAKSRVESMKLIAAAGRTTATTTMATTTATATTTSTATPSNPPLARRNTQN
ncbi:hypothetical protein VARIO8X_160036 [Burkholderiales bacterium 8X]|nr:hypothetical protein VARIO8X_160036 [Burkholderiales bacterium 8X]